MNNRDLLLLDLIRKHYRELLQEKEYVKTFEGFCSNDILKKAIIFDLLQIGENVTKLSKEFQSKLSSYAVRGAIGIRNRLVHGYGSIDEKVVWDTISISLPKFIEEIESLFMEV